MGWDSATEIMDVAVRAMTTTAAEVFQIATDQEHARTPALANWLAEDTRNRHRLDNAMRRGVAEVAAELHRRGWDAPEEADDFERFRQEMLNMDDQQYGAWLLRQLEEAETSEEALAWSKRMERHDKNRKGGA